MSDCNVCTEPYNHLRKEITCHRCEFACCSGCVKRYILETHLDPHCMNCRTAWGKRFLTDILPKHFLTKDWVKRRQQVLLERERARFPATVEVIARENEQQAIDDQIRTLENEARSIKRKILELRLRLRTDIIAQRRTNTEENRYNRPCPASECRGYLSKTSGECGLCKIVFCLECNVKKESDEHRCKEEDVTVWKEISSTTKPCPKCSVRIFKVSGCAQMWCPQCQTAFNWTTGKIETGAIHNPHYYEWLFRTGGAPREQNNICQEGIPHARELARVRWSGHPLQRRWTSFHRLLVHVNIVELPKLTRNVDEDNTLDVRKSYLKHEIDEDQFMTMLQQREKKRHREVEIRRVLEMFRTVGSDLLRGLISNSSVEESTVALNTLIGYVNESMQHIATDYQCKVPSVSTDTLEFKRYT